MQSTTPGGEPQRSLPERGLRATLLWLSHRRFLGRIATATPITRPIVARFVAGERLADALEVLSGIRASGLRTTVDLLGESVASSEAAVTATDRYIETLDALAGAGLDRNVSVKLSQMGLAIDEDLARHNVERIVRRAAELDGFVRLDMEDHTATDRTLAIQRDLRAARTRRGRDPGGAPPERLRPGRARSPTAFGSGSARVRTTNRHPSPTRPRPTWTAATPA